MGLAIGVDPARAAAHAALTDILLHHQALDTALSRRLGALDDHRDRSFCHQLVLTVLRRHGGLRRMLASFVEKPLPPKAKPVELLIELGLAQLFLLDVADHASIDTTVELSGRKGFQRYRKLVNAVLRRAQRNRGRVEEMLSDACVNQAPWLAKRWQGRFGADITAAIAAANLKEPPLDISVGDSPGMWARKLDADVLFRNTLRRTGGTVTDLPGYDDGGWWVQDAAAAIPARLLPTPAGGPVVDLCAAPGGKTAQLAAGGADVIAVDRSARRLRRLDENMRRLSLTATVVEADAAEWRHDAPVGAILLDAPCSATGTIRRRPDIQWTKSAADVASLAALQSRIVDNAVRQLAPGGVLVYSVCSLEPEEGPAQVARVLAQRGDLERLRVTADDLGPLDAALTPEGDVQTLPCHLAEEGGVDGFYIARLRRRTAAPGQSPG